MKIITLTLNPAFDIHCNVKGLALHRENLASITDYEAGGKGVNISRALKAGGVEIVTDLCDGIFGVVISNDNELTFYEKTNGVCLQLYKEKAYYRLCYPRDLFFDADYYHSRVMRLANKIHTS